MKICAFGIPGVILGKHNVKDPRMDQAHQLVEADKKVYAQVDVVGEKEIVDADVILTSQETFPDKLSADDLSAIAAHGFFTNKPVVVAKGEEPDVVILRAFKESGYICFLTVGGKENRAWPIRSGLTAWEAAATIHTDLQKGFIRAEIISFDDFITNGGETQAKRAGKLRLETKTYVMQDYDLVNFRFSK